jgi:hypothetical protein
VKTGCQRTFVLPLVACLYDVMAPKTRAEALRPSDGGATDTNQVGNKKLASTDQLQKEIWRDAQLVAGREPIGPCIPEVAPSPLDTFHPDRECEVPHLVAQFRQF